MMTMNVRKIRKPTYKEIELESAKTNRLLRELLSMYFKKDLELEQFRNEINKTK